MHFFSSRPLWEAVSLLLCGCVIAIQPSQIPNDVFISYVPQAPAPSPGYLPQQPANSYSQPSGQVGYGAIPPSSNPSAYPPANSYGGNNYGSNNPGSYGNNNAPHYPPQTPPQLPPQQNSYGSNNYQLPSNGGNNYAQPNTNYPSINQQPSNSYASPSQPNYGNPPPSQSYTPNQSYGGSSYNRPTSNNNNKGYGPKPYSYSNTSAYEGSVAEAILRGYSYTLNENNNKAIVKLFQDRNLGLNINMLLCNLTTNTYYSFYVHQYGELNNGCESTGPQYTSVPISTHPLTGLQTHPTGFVGFIKTNNESQIFQTNTKELNLDEIIGRSIVIHELAVNASALPNSLNNQMLNNLSLFLNPGSNPFIVGRRLACGVVGRANPLTFNRPANLNCEIELPSENRDIVSFNRVVHTGGNTSSSSSASAPPVSFPG